MKTNILKLCRLWWKCIVIETKLFFATTLEQLEKYNEELNEVDKELGKMGMPVKRGDYE